MTEPTLTDVRENWPYGFQYINPDSRLGEWLGVFVTELQSVSTDIQAVRDSHFIADADLPELTKIARTVGIAPEQGESVEQFRYRLRLELAVASSDGTASDMEAILQAAFGEEALDTITVNVAPDSPELLFLIDPQYIQDSPYPQSRIASLLRRGMPAGTDVQIISDNDVFTFRSDPANANDYEAGFDEGVWTN